MRILSLPRSSHIQDIGMFCAYFLPYIQYLSQIVHNQPNCLWPKKRRNNYLYTFFFTYLQVLFRIMRQITPPPPDPCLPNVCPHVKIFTLYWIVCLVSGLVCIYLYHNPGLVIYYLKFNTHQILLTWYNRIHHISYIHTDTTGDKQVSNSIGIYSLSISNKETVPTMCMLNIRAVTTNIC